MTSSTKHLPISGCSDLRELAISNMSLGLILWRTGGEVCGGAEDSYYFPHVKSCPACHEGASAS
jgi:hypothetical protein